MAYVTGNDGTNTVQGTHGNDLLYGFDPAGPQGQVSSITATRVASGLTQPLFAVAPPGDPTRLFIVEKTGLIKVLDLTSGQVLPTPFLNLTAQISPAGEQGLLGLAFHPDYATNGLFYVQLTNPGGDNEIRRFQVSANPNVADAASDTPVLTIDLPSDATNHRGGWLGFGPDNMLYAAIGDGGSTPNSAQAIDELRGNILRLDVSADAFPGDATRNYAIPGNNPYVGTAGADEIFAIGLRNPWRPSFDRGLGDFYIADVGGGLHEEINIGQLGANYGWPIFEGFDQIGGGTPTGGTATFPIHSYPHNGGGRSITGGYAYRGTSEGLQGNYFFADFVTSQIWTLRLIGSTWVATERTAQIVPNVGTVGSPSSFGEDALGNLYVVDIFGGEVFRLTPNVTSSDQGDVINGLGGDDYIIAGSGDDILNGGPGNDFLNGGLGFDTAVFSGLQSAYTITTLFGDTIRVVGPDGTDLLTGVEQLIFDQFVPRGFSPPALGLAGFGPAAGGWTSDELYPRKLADVNGDGLDDIVGFGSNGVYVALATGVGNFAAATFELAGFGPEAGGWDNDDLYKRELADVNGDGRADIVAFAHNGVYVALATAGGHLAAPTFELAGFGAGPDAGGWVSDDLYKRALGDVNGDGRADIVGFANNGVHVALATGDGHFAAAIFELAAFGAGPDAGGWVSDDLYKRELGDVDGDGRDDIIGFSNNGVYVSLATGGGHFAAATFELAGFAPGAGGWNDDNVFPRHLADVNGDGRDDIVGFANNGVFVSLATGGGHFAAATFELDGFAPAAGGWTDDNLYTRELGDVSGDGKEDIVGFGSSGVFVSLSLI